MMPRTFEMQQRATIAAAAMSARIPPAAIHRAIAAGEMETERMGDFDTVNMPDVFALKRKLRESGTLRRELFDDVEPQPAA